VTKSVRRVTRVAWWVLALSCCVVLHGATPTAPGANAALISRGASEIRSWYVRAPGGPLPSNDVPSQVLLVLHGLGDEGPSFATELADQADGSRWLIVAPTIDYGDWSDPAQVAREDPALIAWLSEFVDRLSERVGVSTQAKILVFGYSRGAQLAIRFAEIHPEQVRAMVALGAGTYTLPLVQGLDGGPITFPFGVADLADYDGGVAFSPTRFSSVPIWVGVGGADDNPTDVPRAWDPYLGTTRVQRAHRFVQALAEMGDAVPIHVFDGTPHAATPEMLTAAGAWLSQMQSNGSLTAPQ
jgi:pimeloyl-ACP methyl ester carboxylesterase